MSPKPRLPDGRGSRDAMMDKLLGVGAPASEDVEPAVAIPEVTATEDPEVAPEPVVEVTATEDPEVAPEPVVEVTATEDPEVAPEPVVEPEPSAVEARDDGPVDDVEEPVLPAAPEEPLVTPAVVADAIKKYGDDPRFRPPLVVAAGRVNKVQLANRVTIPIKNRVDRHKARTGESINSLLERLLDFGLEIAEAEAGVDADGNPVQK